jgi:uncharacterized membrane protein
MIKHEAEITIARPANEVFAYMTRTQNMPKWQPGLITAEELTGSSWHVGTRLKETRRIGGRETEVISEIGSFTPDQSFTVNSVTGPTTHGKFQLDTINNTTTRVCFTIQMEMGGVMRLAEPLIAKDVKRQAEESLIQLKQALEGKE